MDTLRNKDCHLAPRRVLRDFTNDALTKRDSPKADSVLAFAGTTSLLVGIKVPAA